MSHFKDQGVHSLYGSSELQVVMSDTAGGACLSDDQSDKFILRQELRTQDITEQRDWQLLGLLDAFHGSPHAVKGWW